jgi:hypothetical protein
MIVTGVSAMVGASFTRPNNTTAYSSGQIIAQSTTAGSCSALGLPAARLPIPACTGMIRRARLMVNDTAWLNAVVRCHFFKLNPTFSNGDGGNFAGGLNESTYLGACDVTLNEQFSDPYVKGIGAPNAGTEVNFDTASGTQNIYAVLECRSSVTPAASSTWSLTAEVLQN